jgi:hypothetical protein
VTLAFTDVNLICNHGFEGGGWLQVRYNSFGSSPKWYVATDGLRGFDVYGYPGLGEYSIYFKNLMKPESELLIVVGKQEHVLIVTWGNLVNSIAGNFRHWMIMTWGQIYNNGNAYEGMSRTVLKSSTSSSPCTSMLCFLFWFCHCSNISRTFIYRLFQMQPGVGTETSMVKANRSLLYGCKQ